MNTIYDTFVWLQSQVTKKQFPIVEFSGDTDMVTDGWVSLTSIVRPEIVVTQVTTEEYRITKDSDIGLLVERRVNNKLNRADLKYPWLVRTEEVTPSARGLKFQEFLKVYQPCKLYFRDIFSEASLAEEVRRETLSEFERNGGKLMVLK